MESDGAFRSGDSVTLEQVARSAGVSPATVSRCLNRPDLVRTELRERVDAAIARLQYVPNGAARALASRRSRTIGAIFPSLDSSLFGGALESFQSEVAASGYSLVVASSAYDAGSEAEHIENLLACGVDAIMLVGALRDPGLYRLIRRRRIPYVLIWICGEEGEHPCIGFDNHGAAGMVTRYLLQLGHRRVAVVSGLLAGNDRAIARLAGIRATLVEAGIGLPDEHVVETPFGVDEGREAFRRLMSGSDPPTAIVCGSEPFAYGAVFESRVLGIDIPGDVSVTGFDDMSLAAHLAPSLTTVRTPRREMGLRSARYLLAMLREQSVPHPRPLDVELIVRQSTGPPRQGRGLSRPPARLRSAVGPGTGGDRG